MNRVGDCFYGNYLAARNGFQQRAQSAGFSLNAYVHPTARGPDGETLTTDVARLGARDARRVLLISSGTHGVEGFCGSGCQNALLATDAFRGLPADTAVVLVHAVNPYGFAHLRRVNEDNVDCNRNFVRHGAQPPNLAYAEVHPWLLPADWEGPARRAADEAIGRYIAERGARAFQAAVSGGQYEFADGLFYGGRSAVWSNHIWRRIVGEEAGQAAHLIAIDIHTGLGPSGVGEAIFIGTDQDYARARALFGDDVTSVSAGNSTSAMVGGVLADGASEELGADRLSMIALEYGTRPIATVLDALRADNWLYVHGQVDSDLGCRIKAGIRDAFYVDETPWKQSVVDRCLALVERVGREASHVLG